jgi:hypothetical protein
VKWLRANKANPLLIILLLLVLGAGWGAWNAFHPAALYVKTDVEGNFQLGFYDLMSQRKEIYDSSMRTTHGTVMSTITSPDDNRFVFKGKFTQNFAQSGKLYFYLTPIFYSTPQKGLMIDGLVDLLMHTRFWMAPLEVGGKPLVVGQSGSIFVYPLKR